MDHVQLEQPELVGYDLVCSLCGILECHNHIVMVDHAFSTSLGVLVE